MKIRDLSEDHKAALRAARDHFGRTWKDSLASCWMSGAYPYALEPIDYLLQQVRNMAGPSALRTSKPADIA